MQLSELYGSITALLFESTSLPPFVPLVGNLDEIVIRWVRDNPVQAEKVAERMYQLIKKYKEEKER